MIIRAQKAKTALENRRMDEIVNKIHAVLRGYRKEFETLEIAPYRSNSGRVWYGAILTHNSGVILSLNMLNKINTSLKTIGVSLEGISPISERKIDLILSDSGMSATK